MAPASVLEGLDALTVNLNSIAAQTDAHSHDHTESGQGEAGALAQRIQSTARAVGVRIAQMKNELNATIGGDGGRGEGGPMISRQVAVNGLLGGGQPQAPPILVDGGGPTLGLNPVFSSSSISLPQPGVSLRQSNGRSASKGGRGVEIERMDTATSSERSVSSSSLQHSNSVSSNNGGETGGVMPSDTVLYSWGMTALGASFQEIIPTPYLMRGGEGGSEGGGEGGEISKSTSMVPTPPLLAPTMSKYGKNNVANLCSTLYHTVAVTTTGEVYGCGVNEDGQVSPDREEQQLRTPVLVECLLSQCIIQVSCGENHTVCLTASGAVVSFGNNEVGQLGHSAGAAAAVAAAGGGSSRSSRRVGPRTVLGLGGKLIKQISCGCMFTVLLSSEGEVFTCGVGECVGGGGGQDRFQAERVDALRFVPVSFVATGGSHALAITVTGHVWSWGQNRHGQAGGGEGVMVLQEPRQVEGLCGVRSATCGSAHSMFLGEGGEVWGCGKNHRGQLGLPPCPSASPVPGEEGGEGGREGGVGGGGAASPYRVPVLVSQLGGLGVCMLACGDAHTLVLTKSGQVWSMGANSNGQLGMGASAATADSSLHSSSSWRATEVRGLQNARVFMVVAGGEQSFALGLRPAAAATTTTITTTAAAVSTATPLPGLPFLDENTLELVRKFSVIKPATSFLTTSQLLSLIEQAATTLQTDTLERTLFDIFSSPSLVNGSFLSLPHSSSSSSTTSTTTTSSSTLSGLDVQGLESIYVAVMKLNHPPLLSRLMHAFSTALDLVLPLTKYLSDPDSLRCLLVYWQCPLNSNTSLSKDTFLKLCEAIVSLPRAGRAQLFAWARADYPPHFFATRLLRPLHSHLEYHLKVNSGKGRSVPMLAVIMSYLYAANERIGEDGRKIEEEDEEGREGGGPLIPAEQFANAAVSALSVESLLHDLRTWKALKEENKTMNTNKNIFAFCRFPFLLSAEAKRRVLHGEAVLEQQQAAQRDLLRKMFSGGPVSPFLVLRVDRARLLQSTLAQIGGCDPMMLKKQLKVSFVGEEGVDEGGVKKEFFQLLCTQLFDFSYGMFRGTESGREVWFNPSHGSSFGSDDSQEYQLVGALVGLAIYNSVLLDLHFPLVAYKKLLGLSVGLADLRELDAEMGEGLRKLLEWEEEGGGEGGMGGGGKVEDVFGLCFEVDWVVGWFVVSVGW